MLQSEYDSLTSTTEISVTQLSNQATYMLVLFSLQDSCPFAFTK